MQLCGRLRLQSWLMPRSPHHLRNDLKCVEWDVKPCSIQSNLEETTRRLTIFPIIVIHCASIDASDRLLHYFCSVATYHLWPGLDWCVTVLWCHVSVAFLYHFAVLIQPECVVLQWICGLGDNSRADVERRHCKPMADGPSFSYEKLVRET